MLQVYDARGQAVTLPHPPQRIVSLVPSTTETLFALGCGDRVVGVTRFCVHPAERLDGIVKVGGTKDLEVERLRALRPDLVLANAEENTREIFAAVEGICPLYVAFPRTVDEALADLTMTGRLTGTEPAAAAHHARVVAARRRLRPAPFSFAYLIWQKPWMAAGGDTFISQMLAEVGGHNAFADQPERYLELTPEALAAKAPDVVLLSSEPFPFKDRHRAELAEATGLPPERLVLVDGEYCSWHGVRMAAALDYLGGLSLGQGIASH